MDDFYNIINIRKEERKKEKSREIYSGGLTGGRRARASKYPTFQQPPGRQHCSTFICFRYNHFHDNCLYRL